MELSFGEIDKIRNDLDIYYLEICCYGILRFFKIVNLREDFEDYLVNLFFVKEVLELFL